MRKLLIISLLTIATITSIAFSEELTGTKAEEGSVTFSVDNLNCETCSNTFDVALRNILGIEEFSINTEDNTVLIEFDPDVMQEEWIEESLRANGYEVKGL